MLLYWIVLHLNNCLLWRNQLLVMRATANLQSCMSRTKYACGIIDVQLWLIQTTYRTIKDGEQFSSRVRIYSRTLGTRPGRQTALYTPSLHHSTPAPHAPSSSSPLSTRLPIAACLSMSRQKQRKDTAQQQQRGCVRTVLRDTVPVRTSTVGPCTEPLEVVQYGLFPGLHRSQLSTRVPQLTHQPVHIPVSQTRLIAVAR